MADPRGSFEVPSAAALAGENLRLTEAQMRKLCLVLQDVRADLDSYFATHIDRPRRAELTARQKDLEKALKAALKAIGLDAEALNKVLPFELRASLARSLSAEFIVSVTGRAVGPGESVDSWRLTESCFHSGDLLLALIGDISRDLEQGLESMRRDPGGREPDIVRRCLIMSLAEAAPDIIGKRASPIREGPFMKLVTAVFHACDLSVYGLEEAAERALAIWRKRKRRLSAAEIALEELLAGQGPDR